MSNAKFVPPGFKPPSLTDAQIDAFWARVVALQDEARAVARKCAPKQECGDIAHTAAIFYIESFARWPKPAPYPKSDEVFRRQYLAIVRNHAVDCVRGKRKGRPPAHSHWGADQGPVVGGRRLDDRPLDRIFVANHKNQHDVPGTEYPVSCAEDDLWAILHECTLTISQLNIVMALFFDGMTRLEVADALAISVRTVDNTVQDAFKSMRNELSAIVATSTDPGRAHWHEVIRTMSERYQVAHVRRVAKRKQQRAAAEGAPATADGALPGSDGALSRSDGALSRSDGALSQSQGDADKSERADAA